MNAVDTALANPVDVAYLITGILFIMGLRYLSSPKTALLGNRISAVGMLIAVVATLSQGIVNWYVIGAALIVGAAIGIASAHVSVSSTDAVQGGEGKVVFRVPNESATADTTRIRIQLPTRTPIPSVSDWPA